MCDLPVWIGGRSMINQLNGSVTIYGFVGIVFQKLMEPEFSFSSVFLSPEAAFSISS